MDNAGIVEEIKVVQDSNPTDLLSPKSDLFDFPSHIRVDYDGVVQEPDYFKVNRVAKVFLPISLCLHTWYDAVHVTTYYILAIVFGSVLSIAWGLLFGIVNFITVWGVQPFIKLFFTWFRCGYIVTRAWTRMFCDPLFESMALALSKIRVNGNVNVRGIQNDYSKVESGIQNDYSKFEKI